MDEVDRIAAERRIALSYAPSAARAGLAALLALDDRLGEISRAARDPLLGQIRLTWWRDTLAALDRAPRPADPVLAALAQSVVPAGVAANALAGLAEGWGALLDEPLDWAAIERHGAARGGRLFAVAARLLDGGGDDVTTAGEGWALADLSRRLRDPSAAERTRARAKQLLDTALARRWPPTLRALGALAHLARMDLLADARPAGHPLRAARLLRHRLIGR